MGEGVCVSLYFFQSESHWVAGEVGDLGDGRSIAIGDDVRVDVWSGVFMTAS
jgi:hypothetical protein